MCALLIPAVALPLRPSVIATLRPNAKCFRYLRTICKLSAKLCRKSRRVRASETAQISTRNVAASRKINIRHPSAESFQHLLSKNMFNLDAGGKLTHFITPRAPSRNETPLQNVPDQVRQSIGFDGTVLGAFIFFFVMDPAKWKTVLRDTFHVLVRHRLITIMTIITAVDFEWLFAAPATEPRKAGGARRFRKIDLPNVHEISILWTTRKILIRETFLTTKEDCGSSAILVDEEIIWIRVKVVKSMERHHSLGIWVPLKNLGDKFLVYTVIAWSHSIVNVNEINIPGKTTTEYGEIFPQWRLYSCRLFQYWN